MLALFGSSLLTANAQSFEDFERVPNAAISGHNDRSGVYGTPEQCAMACLFEESFACKSFDYNKAANTCDLSAATAKSVGGLKTNYPGNPYDHYALIGAEGSSNGEPIIQQAIPVPGGANSAPQGPVYGPKGPGEPIIQQAIPLPEGVITGPVDPKSAPNGPKGAGAPIPIPYPVVGLPPAGVDGQTDPREALPSPTLGLGGQQALASFTKTSNAAISGHNLKKVYGSPEDCARACVSETGFVCKSFDYERARGSCDLSDATAASVGGLKSDYPNDPYDHYAREP